MATLQRFCDMQPLWRSLWGHLALQTLHYLCPSQLGYQWGTFQRFGGTQPLWGSLSNPHAQITLLYLSILQIDWLLNVSGTWKTTTFTSTWWWTESERRGLKASSEVETILDQVVSVSLERAAKERASKDTATHIFLAISLDFWHTTHSEMLQVLWTEITNPPHSLI